jgi:hypothetical protein
MLVPDGRASGLENGSDVGAFLVDRNSLIHILGPDIR